MTERNASPDPSWIDPTIPRLVIHPDSASSGDDSTMPLTLVPRTHGPAPTNTPHPYPPVDRGRSWLAGLFAGEFAFPAIAPIAVAGSGRTPSENDALARALGCRDLFIFDVTERTTRERVCMDLARAAAARGERVLILSPDAQAVDRMAEACAAGDRFKVVRARADVENAQRLPRNVARLTTRELGFGRVEQLKQEATDTLAQLTAKLPPLECARNALLQMRELVASLTAIDAECETQNARKAHLELEIRNESGTPIAAHLAAVDATIKPFVDGCASAATARHAKDAELEATRHQLEELQAESCKKHGLISRLFSKPKPAASLVDLEKHLLDLEREAHELATAEAKANAEAETALQAANVQRDRIVSAEIAERCSTIEQQLATLADRREQLAADFRDQIAFVFAAGFGVVTPDAAAVERALASVCEAKDAIEKPLALIRGQRDDLNQQGAEHARKLLSEVLIVVGTPGSLHDDAIFERAEFDETPPFGLLVLDHAEELNEPDFAHLTRLAERWVLAGDASFPENMRGTRHTGRASLLARLGRLLNREPWSIEGDRLICRLATLSPAQRRRLLYEPLVDHPDIELCVATDENGQAILAEVVFPASTPVAQAKQFLFRETEQVLLRPLGECMWHHGNDRVSVCWPATESSTLETWIDLDHGVSEKVIGVAEAAFTAAIVFDAAAGWNSEKAEDWLEAHLPDFCTSRLAVLTANEALSTNRQAVVG